MEQEEVLEKLVSDAGEEVSKGSPISSRSHLLSLEKPKQNRKLASPESSIKQEHPLEMRPQRKLDYRPTSKLRQKIDLDEISQPNSRLFEDQTDISCKSQAKSLMISTTGSTKKEEQSDFTDKLSSSTQNESPKSLSKLFLKKGKSFEDTLQKWIQVEGPQRLRESLSRLKLDPEKIPSINLANLSSYELSLEKKDVKHELKRYRNAFIQMFHRKPNKEEEMPMAPLYKYYKKIDYYLKKRLNSESYIAELLEPHNQTFKSPSNFEKTVKKPIQVDTSFENEKTIRKKNKISDDNQNAKSITSLSESMLSLNTVKFKNSSNVSALEWSLFHLNGTRRPKNEESDQF